MYLFSRRIGEITVEFDLIFIGVLVCFKAIIPSNFISFNRVLLKTMVGVAQQVRAPGCGPGGRGFKSHRSPHGVWRSPVSAPALGAGGRGFESLHSDT